MNDGYSSLIRK